MSSSLFWQALTDLGLCVLSFGLQSQGSLVGKLVLDSTDLKIGALLKFVDNPITGKLELKLLTQRQT